MEIITVRASEQRKIDALFIKGYTLACASYGPRHELFHFTKGK